MLWLVGSSCICDTPWAVSHSLSHTRPGYPGCVDVHAKEDPSSPPSMALSVLWRVQRFTFSAVSAETKKKKQKGVLKLSKKKTTPHPAQTRPVSEASVRVQRFSLCDSISEVSLLVAAVSLTRGAAHPQLSRLSDGRLFRCTELQGLAPQLL